MKFAIQPLRAKGVFPGGTVPFGLKEDSVVSARREKRSFPFPYRIENHSQPTFARHGKSRNSKLRKAENEMHRRDFCKVLGAAATVAATTKAWPKLLPAGANEAQNSDYAQFCALPESERIFSIVSGDRIVTEKLDPSTWKPNTYDAPEKLPGIPDSWDGVSMKAPIGGLNGSGPYEANWDSL